MKREEFNALMDIMEAMFEEYKMRDHWMGNGGEYIRLRELKSEFIQEECNG